MISVKKNIKLILIGVLFVNLFIQVIPCLILFALLLLAFIISNNRYENLFLFAYSITVFGIFLNKLGIPYIGGIALIILLAIMVCEENVRKIFLKLLIPLCIILTLLSLTIIYAPDLTSAKAKYLSISTNMLISAIIISYLFANFRKINTLNVSLGLITIIVFALNYSIELFTFTTPNGIFDFGYFRLSQNLDENGILNYQTFGLYLNISLAFLLSHSDITNKFKLTLSLFILILILYLGARQSMIGFIFIFSIFQFNPTKKAKSISVIIISFTLLISTIIWILSNSDIEIFSSLVKSDDIVEASGRKFLYLEAIDLFKNNPLIGVGIGGFSWDGIFGAYPHNIILEILSEFGLIGSLIIYYITVFYKLKLKNSLLKENMLFKIYYAFMAALLSRALFTGSLGTNAELIILSLIPLTLKNLQIGTKPAKEVSLS